MTPTMTPTRMTAWLEQAWLVRYLDRLLAREEADWFEAYVLDKPELLAMIEVDTRLRDALAADVPARHMEWSADDEGRQGGAATTSQDGSLHDSAGAPDAAPIPALSPRPSVPSYPQMAAANASRRPSRGMAPVWLATAASLLLGVGIGWVGLRAPGNSGLPAVIASPTRMIYDTMRGEEVLPRIEHADSASPYVLIEVAVPAGAENIAVRMGDAPPLALTAAADGSIRFIVERRSLASSGDTRVEYNQYGKTKQLPIRMKE